MTLKPQPVFSYKAEGDHFTIYRDTAPLQTPRTLSVSVPQQDLAEEIVAECKGQGEKLDLRKMPLTQMTLTAIDITSHHRQEVIDGIIRYGENELICQRAEEPAELVIKQNEIWQPYLDWCKTTFGANLRVGAGIIPFEQDPKALKILRQYVDAFDNFRLTGVSEAVGICGSLVLGLALVTGYANATRILKTSELDHLWQVKKWGDDPVSQGRQAEIKRDLELCVQWFKLLA